MQKILVPLDGSELSEDILHVIADGFDPADTEVIFLRVGEPADAIITAGSRDLRPLGIVGSTAPATIAALTGRRWGEARGQGLDVPVSRLSLTLITAPSDWHCKDSTWSPWLSSATRPS